MPTRPSTFDEQALGYDARAGLPTAVSAAVAQAIVERAGAGADSSLLVECSGRTTMILCKVKDIDGPFNPHRLWKDAPLLPLSRLRRAGYPRSGWRLGGEGREWVAGRG